jgi:hypothetical protein
LNRRVSLVRSFLLIASLTLVPSAIAATRAADDISNNAASFSLENFERAELGTMDENVLELALTAASCAVRSGAAGNPKTLTVIDYSRPSTQERLWVLDLTTHELLYEELVAHGQGSGGITANTFSNEAETHQTSLGLFKTDSTYIGRNGYSLRLDGLDRGLNDRARERAIVMHGAPYVSEAYVKANGRLGRSWGCPAIRPEVTKELLDRVKGGGLVFAYHSGDARLKSSKYLSGCGA